MALKIDCNPKSQKLSEIGQQAFTIGKFFQEVAPTIGYNQAKPSQP
jgi:hypothetical protein